MNRLQDLRNESPKLQSAALTVGYIDWDPTTSALDVSLNEIALSKSTFYLLTYLLTKL